MKEQIDLINNIMDKFHENDFLDEIILVGSWCLYYYSKYFFKTPELSLLRTKDIDFVIEKPQQITKHIDIKKILEDAGFEEFIGISGYSKFMNIDLDIEFLVNEKGRSSNKPAILKKININAMPLRYLSILQNHTTMIKINDYNLRLPEPAAFVLHKYIISNRRREKTKREKDLYDAQNLSNILIQDNYHKAILKNVYNDMPNGWKKTLKNILQENNLILYNEIVS